MYNTEILSNCPFCNGNLPRGPAYYCPFCGKSLDEKYSKRNYFENEYTNSSEEIIESNFNVMDEKTYSFENSEEKTEKEEKDGRAACPKAGRTAEKEKRKAGF